MPRCGQESRIANTFPSEVAPQHQRHFQQHRRNKFLPTNLRAAHRRIPKSHRNPASSSGVDPRAASAFSCNIVRTASLIVGIVVQRLASQQPRSSSNCVIWNRRILRLEQIDVRHVLLADSPFASTPERRS